MSRSLLVFSFQRLTKKNIMSEAKNNTKTGVSKLDKNPKNKKIILNKRLKIEVLEDFGALKKGTILSPQEDIAKAYIKNKKAKAV